MESDDLGGQKADDYIFLNNTKNENQEIPYDIKDNQNEFKQENEKQIEDKKEYKKDFNKNDYEEKDINGNSIVDGDKELLENQTIKEMQESISELKENNRILEEQLKKKPENINETGNEKDLTQKIKDQEEELTQEKNNNKELSQKIKELEENLAQEIKKNEDLTEQLKNRPMGDGSSTTNESNYSNSLENNKVFEIICEKEEEIKKLRKKLEKAIQLEEGEEQISLIFIEDSEKIHYSVICKNSDKIAKAVDELFKVFPQLKDNFYKYYFNNKRIKEGKTLKENDINNGDIINLVEDKD